MGKVDNITAEVQVPAGETRAEEKPFIMAILDELDAKYLKRLVNFKRVNNPDGSADFSLQLNLNNK